MDWIIQFDPPDDPRDYIHRVGRTARGSNGKGRSLMFLQPSEVGFLKHLKEARVPVVEFEFPASKIVNVQSQLEKLIGQNYYLNKVSSNPSFYHHRVSLTNMCRYSPLRMATVHICKHTPHTPSAPFSISTSWTLSRLRRVSVSRHHLALTSSWVPVLAVTRNSSNRVDGATAASRIIRD